MRERGDNLINPLDLDPITESQFRIYNIIYNFYEANGIPPTVREIAAELKEKHQKSSSTGAVHPVIEKLTELGYLNRIGKKGTARSLVPQIEPHGVKMKKTTGEKDQH